MVRIAPQPFLKSMASQGDSDKPQGHVSDFIPEVDIRRVQHDRLEAAQDNAHAVSSLTGDRRGTAPARPLKLPRKIADNVFWIHFVTLNICISYTFDR